tara:strand:+ start:1929 stop:3269 length:1341 start_codon:yes stop_codon:yes gene_type:complete
MKRKYFGTDGIRGEYENSIMTNSFSRRLGKAVGQWILESKTNPKVVIGRDTRESGILICRAFAEGLSVAGILNVVDLGILPTPAVAVYVRNISADLGVVITASHNPAKDNGIKFFDSRGVKLRDSVEVRIEEILETIQKMDTVGRGNLQTSEEGAGAYLNLLQPILQGYSLRGVKIVLDASHGATFKTSTALLNYFDADLIIAGNNPNGRNINEGIGSQHPEHLASLVKSNAAHLGIAHDGDGDRVLFCDENGDVLHGDVLLALLAKHALEVGNLVKNTLVATVQSNLGLDRALEAAGGRLIRTPIGDRYVLNEMLKFGYNLGGESSGHIIYADVNPTGDGLLAALLVLKIMLKAQKPLSELKHCMLLMPQMTGAVQVQQKPALETLPGIQSVLDNLKEEMGTKGRVLLRYSGTEPIIRLLIEGEDVDQVRDWYQTLEYEVKNQLS